HAGDLVAVRVGLRDVAAVDRTVRRVVLVRRVDERRVDGGDAGLVEVQPVVEQVTGGLQAGVRHARDARVTGLRLRQRRHQRAVAQLGYAAVRRRLTFGPFVQRNEQGSLYRRRVERILELLAGAFVRAVAGTVLMARDEVVAREG